MYQRNHQQKQGICLVCFKNLNQQVSLTNFFSLNTYVCLKCLNKFHFINQVQIIDGIPVRFLYTYNDFMKSLIYQYKGCYDIALKHVFLSQFNVKKMYKGYVIVYPPSNLKEDEVRGYNHMEEIIKTTNMHYLSLFYKSCSYKQSSMHFNQRQKIKKIIKIKNIPIAINKKYLIIDDIYTSGSTLKTIIPLLIKKGIKRENIAALIISKVQ